MKITKTIFLTLISSQEFKMVLNMTELAYSVEKYQNIIYEFVS